MKISKNTKKLTNKHKVNKTPKKCLEGRVAVHDYAIQPNQVC